ncbi:hypothetical protein CDD83_638 [Cordyceps sp. RAO-2017]|nr:hypothetical protein CDD83_638 [Cordyceps sp. RAO-2017]
MHSLAILAAFASTALAAPAAHLEPRAGGFCPAGFLYSSPVCCSTGVLGVLSLDCKPPSKSPDSMNSFKSICASQAGKAMCCVIPVAGLAVLCTEPSGV